MIHFINYNKSIEFQSNFLMPSLHIFFIYYFINLNKNGINLM